MAEEITTTAARVRTVLAEMAGVELSTVTDEKTLMDMGCDSLDAVETVMEVEDKFHIEIPDSDAGKLYAAPVREWVQYVEARMGAKKHHGD